MVRVGCMVRVFSKITSPYFNSFKCDTPKPSLQPEQRALNQGLGQEL